MKARQGTYGVKGRRSVTQGERVKNEEWRMTYFKVKGAVSMFKSKTL